jgi:hypothetical protein
LDAYYYQKTKIEEEGTLPSTKYMLETCTY